MESGSQSLSCAHPVPAEDGEGERLALALRVKVGDGVRERVAPRDDVPVGVRVREGEGVRVCVADMVGVAPPPPHAPNSPAMPPQLRRSVVIVSSRW